MKKLVFVFSGLFGLILISCKTVPLEVPQSEPEVLSQYSEGNPKMEFIGWKASSDTLQTSSVTTQITSNRLIQKTTITQSEFDSWKAFKNDPILKNFGDKLQARGIAENKSFAYFGIYSLQELELYKSNQRYVTFIQVNKNRLSGQAKDSRNAWVACGLSFLGVGLIYNGVSSTINPDDYYLETQREDAKEVKSTLNVLGIGFDLVGALALLIGGTQQIVTNVSYEGNFDIFIYDTQEKRILRRENVVVNYQNDSFKGYYKDSDLPILANYYATKVEKKIFRKYNELGKWLQTNN